MIASIARHVRGTMPALVGLLFLLALLIRPTEARTAGEVTPPEGSAPCVDGMAGPYPCEGVDFLSFVGLDEMGAGEGSEGANLWGWTDTESGKKYVIYGLTDSTAFIEVTDPLNPIYLGSLPTATIPSDAYRDMKVYENYAFIVSDIPSQHGMQVFDLTQLRDVTSPPVTFSATAYYDGFGNAHNIYINRETGYAYVMRITNPNQCDGAVAIVNIQEPTAPVAAGCIDHGGLASDTMCVVYRGSDAEYVGRELCITASDDNIVLDDVTDKDAPVPLGELTYMDIARAHNVWLTADHRYFLSADMNDEHHHGLNTRIFAWDFTDVDDPQLITIYEGPTGASDHNVWIKDNAAYVGNFRAGLRILDLSGLEEGEITQAAFFDMVPEDDNAGHERGAWAVYPFFDDGLIAVSEKERGLYLLSYNTSPTAITLERAMVERNAPSPVAALVAMGALAAMVLLHRAALRKGAPR